MAKAPPDSPDFDPVTFTKRWEEHIQTRDTSPEACLEALDYAIPEQVQAMSPYELHSSLPILMDSVMETLERTLNEMDHAPTEKDMEALMRFSRMQDSLRGITMQPKAKKILISKWSKWFTQDADQFMDLYAWLFGPISSGQRADIQVQLLKASAQRVVDAIQPQCGYRECARFGWLNCRHAREATKQVETRHIFAVVRALNALV